MKYYWTCIYLANMLHNWLMAEKIQIAAGSRTMHAEQVRAQGFVPGVLYGHGIKNESVQVEAKAFQKVFEAAGETTLIELTVNGVVHPVLIRDIQFHPLKDTVNHIDFYQVNLDEKVKAEVPLEAINEAPAVKDLSGILVHNLDTLKIEALPQALPHDIKVDISVLATFDQVIHVKDLVLPAGVTVLSDPEEVVMLVQAPRSEEELAKLSEEATEDVQAVEGVADKVVEPEVEAGEAVAAPKEAEKKE